MPAGRSTDVLLPSSTCLGPTRCGGACLASSAAALASAGLASASAGAAASAGLGSAGLAAAGLALAGRLVSAPATVVKPRITVVMIASRSPIGRWYHASCGVVDRDGDDWESHAAMTASQVSATN